MLVLSWIGNNTCFTNKSCSEKGEEICCDPDESDEERQVCIVQKIMLAHNQEEESQRDILFRTRCIVKR